MLAPLILALFAAAPPIDGVTEVIRALGSRSALERSRAEAKLMLRGPAAQPGLVGALASTDPEVRRQALRVLRRIEAEEDLRPTHITAEFKDATLPQVFAVLQKQAGYSVGWHPMLERIRSLREPSMDGRFTGTFKDAPLWEVIGRVGQACGCQAGPTRAALRFFPGRSDDGQRASHGRFEIRLSQDTADTPEDRRHRDQRWPGRKLWLVVTTEPKVGFLSYGQFRITAMQGADGRSLLPADGMPISSELLPFFDLPDGVGCGVGGPPPMRAFALQGGIPIPPRVPATATPLRLLRGTISAEVGVGWWFRPQTPRSPTRRVEIPFEFRDVPLPPPPAGAAP